MQIIIFSIYLFLAVYMAGNMLTLQIQHYGIYRFVSPEKFKEYMAANNKSALVPSILPAMILLLFNVLLFFDHPAFMSITECWLLVSLNLVALISTFGWQRKLQGQMAVSGYDAKKIKDLVDTNWIRTIVFIIQAITAVLITIKAVAR